MGRALETQVKDTEARDIALCNERDALQLELSDKFLSEEKIKTAMILRNSMIEGMKDPDLDQKRRVLEMLQASIEVKEKIATVECVIPTKTASASLVSSSLNAIAPTISSNDRRNNAFVVQSEPYDLALSLPRKRQVAKPLSA